MCRAPASLEGKGAVFCIFLYYKCSVDLCSTLQCKLIREGKHKPSHNHHLCVNTSGKCFRQVGSTLESCHRYRTSPPNTTLTPLTSQLMDAGIFADWKCPATSAQRAEAGRSELWQQSEFCWSGLCLMEWGSEWVSPETSVLVSNFSTL